ncbi:MAG: nucleotidyltransferase family protein [Candidatus Altiarchaeales archaeon]|nr:MAG: nucleotidyltransferase family protein [Candidatus Asgardarchaeum californiense]RLI93306.1 MAG: nucleotidyltransferase family protein [Candidatus Altiarchaeales archaeon]HDO82524.1 nucleotidyltransferase family protein [Candidatus Altiarchaeales archaeon]HEX55173.1 nucleotidyltransferase family protein [Candidatus Altiarchaeales archaeon]
MKAVILAGGRGTRLEPYTTILPKPLLPVGDVPILDIVIRQLVSHGFNEITLAVGYLAELIMSYVGDGSRYGIKISYSKEKKPLGTAGPLAQIDGLDETFLVMNGDILTTLDYSKLIDFHKKMRGIATIAMRKRNVKIDFGVIEINNRNELEDYTEKPTLHYLVSMGIYIFEPEVLKFIEPNQKLEFPDLVKKLINNKKKVFGYLSDDYWLDIGRHEDYERAQREFDSIKNSLIPRK